jgi:hypothetical protein
MVRVRDDEGEIKTIPVKELATIDPTGWEVFSFNTYTGEQEFRPLTAVQLTRKRATLVKISYKGKSIVCTPDHRIYTQNRGYIEAQHLQEDDLLELSA